MNELGDLEITDPKAMRALAHPTRLSLLERLQRDGPATAAELAGRLGTTSATTGRHLGLLGTFGLVTRDGSVWRAVAKGLYFEPGDDAESQAAYRALANQMFLRSDELPRQWLAHDEPRLPPDWLRVSGLSNARMLMSVDEAAALDAEMEKLLEPYVTRETADAPPDARHVRWLRYVLPDAG